MNNLIQNLKFVTIVGILGIFLTSCSKEVQDPVGPSKVLTCDHISLTVNNLLPADLDSLIIGSENIGRIAAGTSEIICLEESYAYDPAPDYLVLFISALYEDEKVYDGYFCGTGLVPVITGEFEIDITDVNDSFLVYNFKE